MIAFREGRTVVPHINQQTSLCQTLGVCFDTPDKGRTEYDDIHFRQLGTVQNLPRIITEIKGYRNGAAFQYTEINREPFQTVIHQYGNFVSFSDAPANEHICKTVGLFIKNAPCNFPAVRFKSVRLNQIIFFPGSPSGVFFLRIQLHQRDFVGIHSGIPIQKFCYGHILFLLSSFGFLHCKALHH